MLFIFENDCGWLVLDDSYSLKCLAHPSVVPHLCGFAKAACRAAFVSYVVCSSSAASAFDVYGFALAFAH